MLRGARLALPLLALLTLTAAAACESTGVAQGITREACTAAGGQCLAISACSPGKGSLSSIWCGRPGVVCCMQGCGKEDFSCCGDDSATFRPECKNGKLECKPPRKRCPL